MRKSVLLFFIVIVLLLIVNTLMLFQDTSRVDVTVQSAGVLDSHSMMQYANRLVAKGLTNAAIEAYEDYMRISRDEAPEIAAVAYRLGELYMQVFDYEKALAAFYKAEALDPDAEYKTDMDQKIVQALESLGMTTQARYELDARSSLTQSTDGPDAPVARIGKEYITTDEINRALDSLPEWMREQYQSPEGREQFIREYLTQEVLYKKAQRLGLDRTEAVRRQFRQIERQVVIQALLEREIGSELELDERQVELFYKANKEKYVETEAIKVNYVVVEEGEETSVSEAKFAEDGTGETAGWVTRDDEPIPGMELDTAVMDELFACEPGTISGPHEVSGKDYFFRVTEKRAARQRPFEEVRAQVEFELRAEKQQEIIASLIEKTLEEQEVELLSTQ